MKKGFFIALAALLVAPLCGKAQEPRTEANHSVTVNILGLDYAYEQPVGKKFTMTGRIGAAVGLKWNYPRFGDVASSNFSWLAVPTIGAEGRYYHSFGRRAEKGRNTSHNSGSFLSMGAQYYLPCGVVSSKDVEIVSGATVLTPGWGFRRVWRDKWLFEFTTGVNLGVTIPKSEYNYESEFFWAPALSARFGYKF